MRKIEKALADAEYDDRRNFNLLKTKGIESGIKIKRSAVARSRSSFYRADCVEEFQHLGHDKWAKVHGYGCRWIAETAFSSVKKDNGRACDGYKDTKYVSGSCDEVCILQHLSQSGKVREVAGWWLM